MVLFHITGGWGGNFRFCVSICNYGSDLALLLSANLFPNLCACVAVLMAAALWVKLIVSCELFARRSKLCLEKASSNAIAPFFKKL